jgi:hypothetical protein
MSQLDHTPFQRVPFLCKLKELEYLERICDKVGSISVGSGNSILAGLRELVSGKA